MNSHNLPLLPELGDIETIAVLKQLVRSHKALAELKGVAQGMPNQGVLVSTLSANRQETFHPGGRES